jgi:hypothetical protein
MGTAFLRNIKIYKNTTVQKIVKAFSIKIHVFQFSAYSTNGLFSVFFSSFTLAASFTLSASLFFGRASLVPPD